MHMLQIAAVSSNLGLSRRSSLLLQSIQITRLLELGGQPQQRSAGGLACAKPQTEAPTETLKGLECEGLVLGVVDQDAVREAVVLRKMTFGFAAEEFWR